MSKPVYVVHCIDTEGPLYESLEATFERIWENFGLRFTPDASLLKKLQNGEVDLDGREEAMQMMLDPRFLAYYDTWHVLDDMLHDAVSDEFRNQLLDAEGKGWIYNWFCVDHVGYDENPRRRDMGYHNIFDHYTSLLKHTGSHMDDIQFHYHPHTYLNHAHRSGTHWWAFSDTLAQVISRRIIDRGWFPTVNRPGFHVNRPDSHWFMEQYIPFDYSSQAVELSDTDRQQRSVTDGRFGDWRRAPNTWTPYHPAHDDYQTPGQCRRWIARCLNVGTRLRLLTDEIVQQAFAEAQAGKPAILAFTNHDFRDLRPDVDQVREMLQRASAVFPDVEFVYATATTAMRLALDLPAQPPCKLEGELLVSGEGAQTLYIESEVPTFGPQPWLAIKTVNGSYHTDNFDIHTPFHRWSYTFDQNSVPLDVVEKIGVAANNAYGVATVTVKDVKAGTQATRVLNDAIPEPALSCV